MPRTYERWTDEERALLIVAESYDHYVELGGTRTRSSCHNLRQELRAQGLTIPKWNAGTGQAVIDQSGKATMQARQRLPEEVGDLMDDANLGLFEAIEELAIRQQAIHDDDHIRNWTPPDPTRPITIAFMGDFHLGSMGTDYRRLKHEIELIASAPNAFVVLMGDTFENVLPVGKTVMAMFGQMVGPEDQLNYAINRFAPIAKQVIIYLDGNHDHRTQKIAGISMSRAFAKALGCDWVDQGGATIRVHMQDVTYTIWGKHQWRGTSAMNKGNAARTMYDQWPWAYNGELPDVVAMGHTHEEHLEIPYRHGRQVCYIRSGGFKRQDSYATALGFRSTVGTPSITLYPGERRIVVHQGNELEMVLGERQTSGR